MVVTRISSPTVEQNQYSSTGADEDQINSGPNPTEETHNTDNQLMEPLDEEQTSQLLRAENSKPMIQQEAQGEAAAKGVWPRRWLYESFVMNNKCLKAWTTIFIVFALLLTFQVAARACTGIHPQSEVHRSNPNPAHGSSSPGN